MVDRHAPVSGQLVSAHLLAHLVLCVSPCLCCAAWQNSINEPCMHKKEWILC